MEININMIRHNGPRITLFEIIYLEQYKVEPNGDHFFVKKKHAIYRVFNTFLITEEARQQRL